MEHAPDWNRAAMFDGMTRVVSLRTLNALCAKVNRSSPTQGSFSVQGVSRSRIIVRGTRADIGTVFAWFPCYPDPDVTQQPHNPRVVLDIMRAVNDPGNRAAEIFAPLIARK